MVSKGVYSSIERACLSIMMSKLHVVIIFSEAKYKGPHQNPRGSRGLGNHYHFIMYPMLRKGKFQISQILCACITCTNILYK